MKFVTRVSLPKSPDPSKRYPVIYALHGRGSDEKDIYSLVQDLEEDFILIALRGPLQSSPGFSYFDIHRIGFPVIESFEAVLKGLSGFMAEAQKRYPIDPDRQFFVGFSQGAILSLSLAARLGSKLRGIAALHGYLPEHVRSGQIAPKSDRLAVLIAQGATDPLFPPEIGRQNEAFFKTLTQDLTYRVYPHGHSVSGQEVKQLTEWLKEKAEV